MPAIQPSMPPGYYRVFGGLAVVRVGRALVGASPGEEVTVWDADTGERVTNLIANDGATATTATRVDDVGVVTPVGIPATVLRPLFQVGSSGVFLPPGSDSPSGAVLDISEGYATAAASSAATAAGERESAQGSALAASLSADSAATSADQALTYAAEIADAARNASPAAAADRGQLTVGAIGAPFGSAEAYDAFPGVALAPDGRLVLTYRGGPSHTGGTDGKVMLQTSSDRGATWSAPSAIYDPAVDVRDPSLTILEDGTTWLISLFTYNTPASPLPVVQVLRSTDAGATWSAPITASPVGWATSAPIVDRGDGLLMAPLYSAPTSGNAVAAVITSTDAGATWTAPATAVTITGADVQEPALVRSPGGTLLMTYRYGTLDGIGISTYDGSTWSAASRKFTGTGAPRAVYTSAGRLIVSYRTLTTKYLAVRVSDDNGATFYPEVLVDTDLDDMDYAALVEVSRGVVAMVYSYEPTNTSGIAHLRTVYLMSGDGISPLGDAAARIDQVVADTRLIAVADDFQRPDGVLGTSVGGRAWTTPASIAIRSGVAQSTATGVGVATIDPGLSSFRVEADLRWEGGSGVGLVVRYVDASNYLLVTTETNGAALRLYKIVGGTTTQLGSATAVGATTLASEWHRYAVEVRGSKVTVYLDGLAAFAVDLAADANWATFSGKTPVGLRYNPTSAPYVHKCRRFVVYS
jgi:hypothetical protein